MFKQAGKGMVGLAALSQFPTGESNGAEAPQTAPANEPGQTTKPVEKLRIATCQFPVSTNPVENEKYIRDFMRKAVAGGAHLLHTSEACLSGYAGIDFRSFE